MKNSTIKNENNNRNMQMEIWSIPADAIKLNDAARAKKITTKVKGLLQKWRSKVEHDKYVL